MAIYFDFKTINELIRDKYYREQKGFTLEELSQYDGSNYKNIIHSTRSGVEETYDFSPDDWVRYITPLVDSALEEANSGINLEYLFQKFILVGVLVGQGKTFQEALNQISEWETSGIAQLLVKSEMNRVLTM